MVKLSQLLGNFTTNKPNVEIRKGKVGDKSKQIGVFRVSNFLFHVSMHKLMKWIILLSK